MEDAFWTVMFFAIGAITGSFLNVCIFRLPQGKSVVFPSSHCPECQAPIAWYDNVPLFGWIFLLGRCRSCKAPISIRYPLVELLTACLFVLFYKYFGFVPILGPYLVMLGCFIVTVFVDLEHRIIPDEVSVGGMFAGILCSAIVPTLHMESLASLHIGGLIASFIVLACAILSLIYPYVCKELAEQYKKEGGGGSDWVINLGIAIALGIVTAINYFGLNAPWLLSLDASLIGVMVGGGLVYLMGLLGDMVFRRESMGGGDVKFLAMVGAFMGWKLAILSFFIAPFFGAVFGIIEKIRTKDSTIAYGPFLVLGALVSLFWGAQIIEWLIHRGAYG